MKKKKKLVTYLAKEGNKNRAKFMQNKKRKKKKKQSIPWHGGDNC